MSTEKKLGVGLVKAYVTVSANTEYLNVSAAHSIDSLVVCLAECSGISASSVGNECVVLVNVYLIEKVVVHKVTVALIVLGNDGIIFVEVYRFNLGEVELSLVVHINEACIHTNGGRTGCKTENTVRLVLDYLCHYFCSFC